MYTHVCIGHPTVTPEGTVPKIKNGDFATLETLNKHPALKSGKGYKFKEDIIWYCTSLFVPLPPQKEKTVYVSVSEEVVKELSEPVLN